MSPATLAEPHPLVVASRYNVPYVLGKPGLGEVGTIMFEVVVQSSPPQYGPSVDPPPSTPQLREASLVQESTPSLVPPSLSTSTRRSARNP